MMKRHLSGCLIMGFVLFSFFQQAKAQRVGPIKVTASNANLYRDSLKKVIFGTTVFPYDILPDTITTNVHSIDHYAGFPYDPLYFPAGNLDSIDRFVIKLSDNLVDFPDPVTVYLFHPHNNNGKLFIYHSGHCAGASASEDVVDNNAGAEPGLVIPALLADGYTVLTVPMLNYKLSYPVGLVCGYNNHDLLFSEGHYQNAMSFFFTPLIAALNQLGRSSYSSIYMCGLSGGGWASSIYPAIDSSIACSFPVAGSWPLQLNNFFGQGGDYEQYYPPVFHDLMDYHELYTLSCLAPARKMLQVNNRYDECCFNGATAHLFYADSVVKALKGTGGIFKFYLDETETGHQVSKRTMDIMLSFMRNDTAFLENKPADSIRNGSDYLYQVGHNFTLVTAPDNAALRYSLLKSPSWLTLDTFTGKLSGTVPEGNILAPADTVSFKVEDSTGRFVLYSYRIARKRSTPYFFTSPGDNTTLYFLPGYSNSINTINTLSAGSFYFNNPSLLVLDISLDNNSVIKLSLNAPVTINDSIGYNGFATPYALTYNNGLKLDDFGLNPIQLDGITLRHAVAGMIRFNTETNKFEYFNGTTWIDMN